MIVYFESLLYHNMAFLDAVNEFFGKTRASKEHVLLYYQKLVDSIQKGHV